MPDRARRATRRWGPTRRWSQLALVPAALLTLNTMSIPATSAALPSLSVLDVSVTELDSVGLVANVKVQLSSQPSRLVTVDYQTVDGTAAAPGDYTARTGTLRFRPDEGRTRIVTVPIKGDVLDEAAELFRVRLANPYQARIADPVGVVTIRDNDPLPRLRVQDVIADEEDTGTYTLQFPITLSARSGRPVTVSYAITPGSATFNSDYTADPVSGTVRFPAGIMSRSIGISVIGDTVDETPETVNLSLVAPVNASLPDGSAVATIRDDDGPGLAISNAATVAEGGTATFTVSLPAPSPETVSVSYATANGTAAAPGDYTARTGTLTFAPGETSKPVTVPSVNDAIDEVDEYFYVELSTPVNAEIADGSGYTFIDDNDGPTISVSNAPLVSEGGTSVFTVSLSAASPQSISVQYQSSNGSAVSPGDYTPVSGTVTFSAGQTTRTLTVPTINDVVVEEDEYYWMLLSGPVDASVADGSGLGYIDGNSVQSKATYIGSVRGDDGADVVTKTSSSDPSGDVDWYRFYLTETEFGVFDDDLNARVQLNVFEGGGDLDMCLYWPNGSLIGCSSLGGTTDETYTVYVEDDTGDDSTYIDVRVAQFSGVNNYTLRVEGDI